VSDGKESQFFVGRGHRTFDRSPLDRPTLRRKRLSREDWIEDECRLSASKIRASQCIEARQRTGRAIQSRENCLLLFAREGNTGNLCCCFQHLARDSRRILRHRHQRSGHQGKTYSRKAFEKTTAVKREALLIHAA